MGTLGRMVLVALAVGAAVPPSVGAQTERELERLEAERQALERAREAMERTRERLEEVLRQRGEAEPLRFEAFRVPGLEGGGVLRGFASRPRLGISLGGEQTDDVTRQGARILSVMEGGPADDAGLREGDIITAIGGVSVLDPLPGDREPTVRSESAAPVERVLVLARELEPGEEVQVAYLRDGVPGTATVVPEDLGGWGSLAGPEGVRIWSGPGTRTPPRLRMQEGAPTRVRALGTRDLCIFPGLMGGMGPGCLGGLELAELNPGLGGYFGTEAGVLVLDAADDSTLGLRAGDVILEIGGREVTDPSQARRILASYDDGEEVEFRILRDRGELTVRGRLD